MKTEAQRITNICAIMRKSAEGEERQIKRKEEKISKLRRRLSTVTPEEAVLIREMIGDLENELENIDKPQLEVLRLDILENCGPA